MVGIARHSHSENFWKPFALRSLLTGLRALNTRVRAFIVFSVGAAQVPKVSRHDKSICDGRHRQTHSLARLLWRDADASSSRAFHFVGGVVATRPLMQRATEAGSCELARPRRRLGISTMV